MKLHKWSNPKAQNFERVHYKHLCWVYISNDHLNWNIYCCSNYLHNQNYECKIPKFQPRRNFLEKG